MAIPLGKLFCSLVILLLLTAMFLTSVPLNQQVTQFYQPLKQDSLNWPDFCNQKGKREVEKSSIKKTFMLLLQDTW